MIFSAFSGKRMLILCGKCLKFAWVLVIMVLPLLTHCNTYFYYLLFLKLDNRNFMLLIASTARYTCIEILLFFQITQIFSSIIPYALLLQNVTVTVQSIVSTVTEIYSFNIFSILESNYFFNDSFLLSYLKYMLEVTMYLAPKSEIKLSPEIYLRSPGPKILFLENCVYMCVCVNSCYFSVFYDFLKNSFKAFVTE